MSTTVERHEFQAEAKQLLDLMIHSVYSNKEIFLRELISNASDAIDKRRVASLSDSKIEFPAEPEIRIEVDDANRTLTLIDTGIGMSRSEVVEYIGTLAKSGTKEFLAKMKEAKEAGSPELIGQFGVGFYSSFLVADRVDMTTRRAGEDTATLWKSTGDGTYTLDDAERDEPGTSITLHLKPADEENGLDDFTKEWKIREIVKKYSDFVTYPVKMEIERTEGEGDEVKTVRETETLNSMKAIWARDPGEVEDDEYNEFYKHISHDWTDPLTRIRFKAEGTLEYTMLLFIPSQAPMDLFQFQQRRGVNLYVKRIFIMDDCEDLVPSHLRFVRGVVDSEDLSLNISREILQQDRQIQLMRKQLEKKVLSEIERLKRDDKEKFQTFWKHFGAVLKEGIFAGFGQSENAEQILSLCLFDSTKDERVTLSDYVSRMQSGQEKIYYMTGENREVLSHSPHLEAYRKKELEVLFLTDPVDEVWTGSMPPNYQDYEFESVGKGSADLGTDEEKKEAEEKLDKQKDEFGSLLEALQKHLDDDVKEVRLSRRLTESPACLVGDEHDMTPQMEQMLKSMGRDPGKQKRILELNPDHPILGSLKKVFSENADDSQIADYAHLIHGQATLAEGGKLADPARFSRLLTELMTKAM